MTTTLLAVSAPMCSWPAAAVVGRSHGPLCLVGEGQCDRCDVAVLRGGIFRQRGSVGLAGDRAAAGQIPVAVDARGRARPQDRRPRRDLSLGRGGRREQRPERPAAVLPAALLAQARRALAQGARRDHGSGIHRRGLSDDLSDNDLLSSGAQEPPTWKRTAVRTQARARSRRRKGALEPIPRLDFRPMPMPTLPPKP